MKKEPGASRPKIFMAAACVVMFTTSLVHWIFALQQRYYLAGALEHIGDETLSCLGSQPDTTLHLGEPEPCRRLRSAIISLTSNRNPRLGPVGRSALVLVNVSLGLNFS